MCIYIYIDSLLRRLIILFLSFSYRLDRQLVLRCNAMIIIPGKGTEPHGLCSVPHAVCCASCAECSGMILQALCCVCCEVLCAATFCHTLLCSLLLCAAVLCPE